MNKTQKGALCSITGIILAFAIVSYLMVQIGIRHRPPSRMVFYVILFGCVLIPGISIYFLRKKQSPNEPDYDERDNRIKQRAWIAAFISVWPLFLAASVIPQLFVGLDGTIPAWLLPIVTVSLSYPVLLIYSIAVLIQYGRGARGERS